MNTEIKGKCTPEAWNAESHGDNFYLLNKKEYFPCRTQSVGRIAKMVTFLLCWTSCQKMIVVADFCCSLRSEHILFFFTRTDCSVSQFSKAI